MGRLTRCCEKNSKEISCYVKAAGIRLYTTEELSYFLQNYLYLIDENFFDSELLIFLRDGLGRQDLFELVNRSAQKEDPIVLAGKLAGATGDLSRKELSALTQRINEFRRLSPAGRRRIQADMLMDRREFERADAIYCQLLSELEQDDRNLQERGLVYYQKGRICTALFEWEKAGDYFVRAYDILKQEEILQVLFELSRISSVPVCSENLFRAAGTEKLARWESEFRKRRTQIDEEAEQQISQLSGGDGESEAFYRKAEELTDSWQREYRRISKA